MRLDTFARLAQPRSSEEYCARYPHAALVFGAGSVADQCTARAIDLREIQFLVKTRRNLFGDAIVVGRALTNDLKIDHPTVSKIHAAFLRDGGQWSIMDPGSTNGTLVEGVRVGKNEVIRLKDGMRLDLGGEIIARFYSPRGIHDLLVEVLGLSNAVA